MNEEIAVKQNNVIIYQKINDFIKDNDDVDLYTAHEIQKMLDVDEADIIEFKNIAVEKFKEELKNKIDKLIKKLEKSLVKLTNTNRAYQQGKIEQLRELLKLL